MERETVRHEVEALARLKDTDAAACLLRKLGEVVAGTGKTIPLNETNWDLKTAHAQGYRDCAVALNDWLSGRMNGYVDDDGNLKLGRK